MVLIVVVRFCLTDLHRDLHERAGRLNLELITSSQRTRWDVVDLVTYWSARVGPRAQIASRGPMLGFSLAVSLRTNGTLHCSVWFRL
jgi:hypothetical protein